MNPDTLSSLTGNLWSIFLIVLFGGGSIFVHELGHFLAARRRGLKVDRFSIGFGPAIWRKRGKDGVEYRLGILPLGGYVALPQLADLREIEGEPSTDAATLPPPSYSTKMIVFAAGAFFNILFAFALATVLWIVGQQTSEDLSTTRIGYISEKIQLPNGQEVPSPAREGGLQVGDVVRAVDGHRVNDWPELLNTLVTSSGVTEDGRRRTIFSVERQGQPLDLTLYPVLVTEERIRKIGVLAAYTPIVAQVPEKSYAEKLGLKPDDELVALNGQPLYNLLSLYDALQAKPAAPVTLTVRRAGQNSEIVIPADRPVEAAGIFGAGFRTNTGIIHENPFAQLAGHLRNTWRFMASLVAPTSDIGISKLSGPIGIGRVFWQASEAGFRYVLWITILINLNLAIFNLLPFPILDGGQMLFATIGKLRGRALPPNFIATAHSVAFVLLITLIIYVGFFDVRRLRRDNTAEPPKATESAKP